MLDPALLRENLEQVRVGLRNRGLELTSELEDLATLESRRRRILPELEGLKREQNATGDEVARARRQGAEVTKLQAASKHRSQQIKQLAAELDTVEKRRNRGLLAIPNLPHESVPIGKSASENAEVRRVGTPREFAFTPQAHWDLGPALGIIDFERGTKGEFNWSSQHLDDEVLRWRNGNGDGQTGRVDLRCVRLAGRR